MTDNRMTMTEGCRLNFDYYEGCFDNKKDAYRTQAWLKETFGIDSNVKVVGSKQNLYAVIMNLGDTKESFHPQTASFANWADFAKKAAHKLWLYQDQQRANADNQLKHFRG